MATKTISIMEDVYKLLLRNKMRNESFSGIIRRTLTKNDNILEFAGAWGEVKEEDAEKMKKAIDDLRKRSARELTEK